MAGDWIKMRIELQSHPKVVRILSATGTDKFRVIGGLHAVWSVFDAHSTDGILFGYNPDALDHVIGWPGFSAAMMAVGWLKFDGSETIECPEFSEHNGQSAKRRAEDQKRKRDTRACPQSVRNLSAIDEDKKRTREEKRRKEVNPPTPSGVESRFDEFWLAYPKKIGKGAAEKAWIKARINGHAGDVIAAVEQQKLSDQWKKDGGQYIPNPATWLNQRRWEDETTAGGFTASPENNIFRGMI